MPKRRMPPLAIVENFNVLKNISSGFSSCPIVLTMDSLSFKQGKKTFHHGIIVAIPNSTHAAHDPLVLEDLLKFGAGILTSSIGVMNQARNWGSLPQGHIEGIQNQVALQPSTRTPPHHLSGIQIEDDRQI